MRVLKLVLLFVALALSGCTTVQTADEAMSVAERLYVDSYEKVYSTALNTISGLELEVASSDQDKGEIMARLPHNKFTFRDAMSLVPGFVHSDLIVVEVVDLGDHIQVDMKIIYFSGQQDWSEYFPRFFEKLNTQLSRK